MLFGCGSGGGGSGGRNAVSDAGQHGNSVTPYIIWVDVVPNTSYTVTIGAGGSGGAARTTATQNSTNGNATTFGALASFPGALAIGTASQTTWNVYTGKVPYGVYGVNGQTYSTNQNIVANKVKNAYGGNLIQGTASGSYRGGCSGLYGAFNSAGGAGGNANNAGTGVVGGTGSGFGSGGGGGGSGTTGAAGGAGAPGFLEVCWVE